MAVANGTNSTIILSNRMGVVGGFESSPMPTVRVTSGVSVKIPVVIPRIDCLDENGNIAQAASANIFYEKDGIQVLEAYDFLYEIENKQILGAAISRIEKGFTNFVVKLQLTWKRRKHTSHKEQKRDGTNTGWIRITSILCQTKEKRIRL